MPKLPANQIDARVHLASLAGKTITGVFHGEPYRIMGVTRDHVFVSAAHAPLGGAVALVDVQSAFDRLTSGAAVPISEARLGKDDDFLAAALLSIPGATLHHAPARVTLSAAPRPSKASAHLP